MKKILLILMFISQNLLGQIAVNPPVIFIDKESKSSQITLTNTGIETKQIEVSFKFGYTVTNADGKNEIVYGDSLPLADHSLVPYIKVFPKKIVLGPNKNQTVMFVLKNASKIPDGTYWTRVILKSSPMLPQTDSNSRLSTAQMVFVIESNTIAVFEKGSVNTDLTLNKISTSSDSNKFYIITDLSTSGNSPFWGTARINVYDKDDELIDVISELIPVYTSGIRAFGIDRKKLFPGDYSAELLINSYHPDIKDHLKIKIKPIEAKYRFTIK